MCVHQFVCISFCNVCVLCGEMHQILLLDTYNVYSAPISRGYSRRLRFKTKIDKILFGHPEPKFEDPVWKYLTSKKDELVTPLCIREALKQSTLVCKHYDNVRLFCDIFTHFKVQQINVLKVHKYMLDMFAIIHSAWNFSDHPNFFSYTWLIRFLLKRIQSDYIVYLKAPTSSKRHDKYTDLFDLIIPPETCDEMLNHVLVKNRSLSE